MSSRGTELSLLYFSRFPLAISVHGAQNKKKKANPITNWTEDLDRHLFKEDIQMVKGHMKRCSASLMISEMQILWFLRQGLVYHISYVRVNRPKEFEVFCEKSEPGGTAWPQEDGNTRQFCLQCCSRHQPSTCFELLCPLGTEDLELVHRLDLRRSATLPKGSWLRSPRSLD